MREILETREIEGWMNSTARETREYGRRSGTYRGNGACELVNLFLLDDLRVFAKHGAQGIALIRAVDFFQLCPPVFQFLFKILQVRVCVRFGIRITGRERSVYWYGDYGAVRP